MRILTFTSLFPNARQPLHGIFVQQRVRHLARRGHFVRVIAPVPYVPRWMPVKRWKIMADVPDKERVGELEVRHPRYPLMPRISMALHGVLMYLGCVDMVKRLHENYSFDLLDAHYVYPDGLAALLLGKRLGLPVVVTARGTDINLFPTFRLIRPQIRWALRHAAGVISVCDALKQEMFGLGLSREKAWTIGNGIDAERFAQVPRQEARAKLNIPADAEVVVSVGALIPRKGYQFLIPAVAALKSAHPQLQLYVIGEGESRPALENLVGAHRVRESVFFVGSRPNEELKYWYSAADASCLASSREGWANVLLESLACGTPPVATRVWGAPEVIVSPELGILVDQNSQSIAQGLDQAMKKRWDREGLARYARTRTWDEVAREVELFLDSLIRIKHPVSANSVPEASRFV
jgi:glycosyltransferase involved in cell wall biosynthesis